MIVSTLVSGLRCDGNHGRAGGASAHVCGFAVRVCVVVCVCGCVSCQLVSVPFYVGLCASSRCLRCVSGARLLWLCLAVPVVCVLNTDGRDVGKSKDNHQCKIGAAAARACV